MIVTFIFWKRRKWIHFQSIRAILAETVHLWFILMKQQHKNNNEKTYTSVSFTNYISSNSNTNENDKCKKIALANRLRMYERYPNQTKEFHVNVFVRSYHQRICWLSCRVAVDFEVFIFSGITVMWTKNKNRKKMQLRTYTFLFVQCAYMYTCKTHTKRSIHLLHWSYSMHWNEEIKIGMCNIIDKLKIFR